MAKRREWLPLTTQSLSSFEFSPTAIADYAKAFSLCKKPPHSLAILVRKQLSRLNWKIEFMYDPRNSFRYRYTSPTDGKIYLSLHLLCNDLIGGNCGFVCSDSDQRHTRKKKKREDEDDDDFSESLSSEVTEDERQEEEKCDQIIRVKQANSFNPTLQPVNSSKNQNRLCILSSSTGDEGREEEKCDQTIRVKQANSLNSTLQHVNSLKIRNRFSNLSSLIDNNVVMEGEKVHYRATKNRPELIGWITRHGIECGCCRNILPLTEFESHAGSTKHRPAANIILEDGRSISDCQTQFLSKGKVLKLNVSSILKSEGKILKPNIISKPNTNSKKKKKEKKRKKRSDSEEEKGSDYVCSVCLEGGDLIVCDECPSAFHKICLGIKDFPLDHWYCPFCCCDYCGCRKLSHLKKESTILRCEQCQRKIHLRCAEDRGMLKLKENSNWFCSGKCENIYWGLQNLIGKPIVIGEDNLTWTLLKGRESDSFENNKLGLALELLHECFEPVEEFFTGRDLVEDVIFSRECDLNRLNFRRFYTILLQKDDEAISVANLRVSGDKVAELPLVATGFQHRGRGMCKKLMDELEKQLIHMGVEKLVLPSASTTLQTWTDGFGFSVMTDSDKKQYLDYNFLFFQGTVMCHKLLRKM